MESRRVFHWADYVVFSLMLLVSALIGVYYGIVGRRQESATDILLGGRQMQVVPVALSVQASFISAVFVLGIPAEVYYFGTMYGLITIGYLLAYPVTAHIFVPKLHKLKLISGYEYLERRFSKATRTMASSVFIIMTILYMAVVLYAPALAFSQVTGLSMLVTIVGTGVICTFYTTLGGMKAVIWTDSFQMLVIFGGLLALVIQGSLDCGGMSRAFKVGLRDKRIDFNNFSLVPTVRTTVWSQVIGGFFLTLTLHAANQTLIQRYLSINKCRDAQKAVYLGLLGASVYLVLVLLVGIVMYAFYEGCDPLMSEVITKADQMVPLFMMDVLGKYRGLPGLVTACTFSAALSTVSSGVNALAAVILEDIIKPLYLYLHRSTTCTLSPRAAVNITKILAVLFGMLTILLGYLAQYLGDTVVQLALSVFGMAGGPLLGVFFLAMFFPFANATGALCGLSVSLVLSLWVGMGAVFSPGPKPLLDVSMARCNDSSAWHSAVANLTENVTVVELLSDALPTTANSLSETWNPIQPFYNMSYMWYSTFAVLVALAVGIPISLLTGGHKNECVDPSLMFSFRRDCLATSDKVQTTDSIEKDNEMPLFYDNTACSNRSIGNTYKPQSV